MGVESTLRTWARRSGLQHSRIVTAAYTGATRVRFARRWDEPVAFRGGSFVIGRDLSLYPGVRDGSFETHELDALLPRVAPDAVVWDVGANVGIYAVLLGRAAHRGHVVSFEPVPETHERLVENLRRNGVLNVTTERVALSDRDGDATVRVFPDAHGCDRIVADGTAAGYATTSVRTTTGTAYAARSPLGPPDVVKVDIEGHEPAFLRGAWDVITARRPTILMEVNPNTWQGPADVATWQHVIDDLLGLYGAGTWFGVDGGRRIETLDVTTLTGGPFNVLLPAG